MDITNLSLDELKALQNKVVNAINDKQNSGFVCAKKAFMESKEAKAIRKRAVELKDAFIKLDKAVRQGVKFAIAATVRVEAAMKFTEDDIYDSVTYQRDTSDFVDVEVKGKLLHANRYDKQLVADIQSTMNDILGGVCSAILRGDKNTYNLLEAFTEKHNSLVIDLEDALRNAGVYGRLSLAEIMEN